MVSISGLPVMPSDSTTLAPLSTSAIADPVQTLETALGQVITTDPEFSALGLVLNELNQGPALINTESMAIATSGAPLLTATPHPENPSTATLADHLSTHLEQSGLFYESHLARWANGEYPIERLKEELQGGRIRGEDVVLKESPNASSPTERHLTPLEHLNPSFDTFTRLQSQLHVLDHNSVAWQGTVWPGQQAWVVFSRGESGQQRSSHGVEEPQDVAWHSQLSINMPDLGAVHADLYLHSHGVRIAMAAESQKVTLLRQSLPLLNQYLEAAGIPPISLSVNASSEDNS